MQWRWVPINAAQHYEGVRFNVIINTEVVLVSNFQVKEG